MPRRIAITYRFRHPLEVVWPLASHTELLNRLTGKPPVSVEDVPQEDGLVHRAVRTRLAGLFEGRYEERPFHWNHGRHYEVERFFDGGPLRWLRYRMDATADGPDWSSGGCTVQDVVEIEAPALLAPALEAVVRHVELPKQHTAYRALEAALDRGEHPAQLAAHTEALADVAGPPRAANATERQRIEAGLDATREVLDSPWLERLAEALRDKDPAELHRMRPLAFARRWNAPRREVIELFLSATRAGLLRMRWDVLCPHCRGQRQALASLSEVREDGFCTSCQVHFDLDLGRNLEAVFAPHPAVRAAEAESWCLGGPGANPHVFFQHVLQPEEVLDTTLRLPPGRYRLRVSGASSHPWLEASEGGGDEASLTVTGEGVAAQDLRLAAGRDVALRLANRAGRRVKIVVETAAWLQDVLPAGELMTAQRFRDLFSDEALAPGVQLAVERIAVLFTDLVGSTAMYRRIGDARAFRLVWSHFDGLREAIDEEGGAIVKTIGDAVMAVFPTAREALRAAARFQEAIDREVGTLGFADEPVRLRIGIAEGPCIAVNLNDRLDYFGTTVNLAARVQGRSAEGEILVTRDAAGRSDAAAVLGTGWTAADGRIEAKGFEERVEVIRFARR